MTRAAALAAAAFSLLSVATTSAQPLPAFPGADGAAAGATGGRGGLVYHVTKLDQNYSDAVEGTLRYGLTDGNFGGQPRTIVFDVAGTFWLGRYGADRGHDNGWDTQSRLNLGSNVTIAGQSAPGPVYIMGGVVKANGSNTVLRNVTIAPGYGLRNFAKPDEGIEPTPGNFPDSYTYDALDISGTNQMIDHVTTLYATDETISANELADNITIQYTTIAQGQNYPQADAEASGLRYTGHALGSLLQAGSGAEISVLNNLYAHQKGRMPRIGSEVGTGPYNDFRNNVFYNWLGSATQSASGQRSFNNFIGNFYLAGPGGEDPVGGTSTAITNRSGGTGIGGGNSTNRIFATGNLKDTNKDGDALDTSTASYSSAVESQAYDVNLGVTLTATQAYNNTLDYVGSNWWNRDAVDERLINEVRTGTGKIIAWADDPFNNDPNEGVEWRQMLSYRADTSTGAAPFNRAADWDTEDNGPGAAPGDGMPTYWELEHGLDPNAADNNGDFDQDGYTNLEEYLNEVAAWPAPAPVVFDGASNNRYAQIQNWRVSGIDLAIQGKGTQTTYSNWQPSRYDDTYLQGSAVVDAVGQHAGYLTIAAEAGSTAGLTVSDGWLRAHEAVLIGGAGAASATLALEGGTLYTPMLMKSAQGAFAFTGGELHADGVSFDLLVEGGTVAPGDLTNQLIVDGDLTLQSGALAISISPTEGADAVAVTGQATLGGDLLVALDGFTPAAAESFVVLVADTITGVFDNLSGGRVGVAGGGTFFATITDTMVTLSDYAAALAADFNSDGLVDAADYTVWRDGVGTTYTEADYTAWAVNYGAVATGVSTGVPEPCGVLLAATAMVFGGAWRVRRKS
ncbi:Pectate lyase [Botrimarina colliarenosi]|uniref:Probable pectate lyase C n=2 Tax=Botrimarina colliarenosi TaxID=2528001 RepID=A0A5C6AG43_9BACT|nr:Pectate lyase [Botrimarina colliarenosi]